MFSTQILYSVQCICNRNKIQKYFSMQCVSNRNTNLDTIVFRKNMPTISILMKYLHEEDKLFTSNSKKQFWVFTAIFWHIFHLLLDPDSGSKRLRIWIQEAKWTHGSGYEKLILNDQSFIHLPADAARIDIDDPKIC